MNGRRRWPLYVRCCRKKFTFAISSPDEFLLLWTNGWMHQDATWNGGRPQPRRLCVRWGPSPHPQKGGGAPQFSACVYCGQMAICIRIPLGTEVGFSVGDIVLDEYPAPPQKKRHSPHPMFGPCLLRPNRWTDEDATWCGSRPQPRPHCGSWRPSSPPPKRGRASLQFSAHAYCG